MSQTLHTGDAAAEFSSLIEAIYQASLDASLWPAAVEGIRVALGGSTAVLATLESRPQEGGFSYSRQLGASDFTEWGRFSRQSAWLAGWKRLGSPQERVFLAHEIAP
ncbi:MAG TPA: hypothetical protein VL359_18560, partial [bacterium]|nr:hypothetical protein [bacterium]